MNPELPQNHSMWDVFEHILLFISLYVFATSFTLLLHAFINQWVPVTSSDYSSYNVINSLSHSLIRSYLSAIIVSYPLFTYLFLRITKNTIQKPFLRTLRARKVMIYLTLVITFIISLASIISIVFNFLGGNVSLNFVYHFLTTFFVSSLIFIYYTSQVKEDRQTHAQI